jgi:hypothetical protein
MTALYKFPFKPGISRVKRCGLNYYEMEKKCQRKNLPENLPRNPQGGALTKGREAGIVDYHV